MFLLVRFPMCIDRNSGNNDLTQGLVGRVKFLPWPTSPGYSLDQLQPCAHTGSHLKAPLHFSGSLSLGHMAHMAAMKMHLCHPRSGKQIDHSSSCGLLKSITIHHASCGMLPATPEQSRDTGACPFLGDIGRLWWAPWAWGPPIKLAEHHRSALQFLFHWPTYLLVLWPTLQSDALSASQAAGPFFLRGPSPVRSLAYWILSPAS